MHLEPVRTAGSEIRRISGNILIPEFHDTYINYSIGDKMNRNQNERNRNLEKPIPGCLGRMVNLFDLNTSIGGNRLLTDKPHYEGSPVSRSQSDVSRSRIVDDQINDKVIVSELGKSPSNRKLNGTPIKMLIAEEMSKEEGPKQSPPNLVAKLMGLDALPQRHQLGSASCRTNLRGPRNHLGSTGFIEKEHGFLNTREHNEINLYQEQGEYKDVYEIWQQSCKTCGDLPQRGRCKQSKNEKSMALVREKFMEAKRLSTDEKHRQSKKFQEALEVLSSNKDLFLKLLQEPNSLFAQHHNLQSVPPPPDSRRITVLKPSKLVDGHKLTGSGKKNGKQINETAQMGHCNMWDKSNSRFLQSPECYKYNGYPTQPTQPTRIVVLKPSSGKPHEMKVVASPPSSLRTSNDDGFYGDPEDSETLESREVPKESTCGMSENPSSHRRDETLLSSVFSNGYIGDESSFSKSEVYYAAGNLSDSEVMSPTSRHSWDYINRFGSPYSCSSFSRASYSPESSVCREAKKRLSERWAMMALNGSVQEQRHIRRSSSTLGEMLALSDLKKSAESEELCKKREGSKASTSYLTIDLNKAEDADSSPKNLARSKSVPVSSGISGSRLGEDSDVLDGKKDDSKDLTKEKGVKSSLFKGLFFSKSRKSGKLKSHKSDDEHQSAMHSPRRIGTDGSQCVNDMVVEDVPGLNGSLRKASCQGPADAGLVGEHLPERGYSVRKPETPGNANENQDQPSPISVLELQFEDDDHTAEEEQACFLYVQTLLSAAGIDGEVQSGSFSTRWHSPETPLDPRLRDTYMSLTDNEPLVVHRAKQRHRKSIQRLVFDCVNEALIGITGCSGHVVAEHVWRQMKEWISGEERCVWDSDGGTAAVERVVRKEVVGEVWVEHLRLEIENIKKEIEEKVVKEVVEECVIELTDRGVILGYNP
ncbi:protein of unknown function DUF4378 [Cynara cardunculus var. scolymus]|uniref:DUF3741-associated sequence motif protein n=1 Tax=Cynara cardunculus var. scolymus TaxID=59895 RepID=A0A118K7J3_CYNCS|nr:protein of unknown function DUF4378 [Cynara cardunculus var. scolymus]